MQQTLQDREVAKNSKNRQQNQDIPLQHNNSDNSNQIKSAILSNYLQNPKQQYAEQQKRLLGEVKSNEIN